MVPLRALPADGSLIVPAEASFKYLYPLLPEKDPEA